jgi:hypothetical protein
MTALAVELEDGHMGCGTEDKEDEEYGGDWCVNAYGGKAAEISVLWDIGRPRGFF